MNTSKNQDFLQSLIARAWEDEGFKNELLENPKEAIEAFAGKALSLPEGKTFRAVDQTDPDVIYINIPSKPQLENVELNEEQLEAVAGGDSVIDWAIEKIETWLNWEEQL